MSKMGCGCDSLGCACDSLGCACEGMGCGCMDKGLGRVEKATGLNPWWFLIGAGVGVGAWYLLKNTVALPGSTPSAPTSTAGQTVAAPMPKTVSPSKYQNLQAVAIRLDELKTLYRSGRLTPEQAIAECEVLIAVANGFRSQDAERANEVVMSILAFEAEIQDFIQFKKDNPSIPAYVPA